MFTNRELSFYRFLAKDKDYIVLLFLLAVALAGIYFVFGGWALLTLFGGMLNGYGLRQMQEEYEEFKNDEAFRNDFDRWEIQSWEK